MHHPLSDQSAPPRVYRDTAPPPPPPTTPLHRSSNVDVAVIVAGFTGLSTALRLGKAVCTMVLEAKQTGCCASGGAFGQALPYLKCGHERVLRQYGQDATQSESRP